MDRNHTKHQVFCLKKVSNNLSGLQNPTGLGSEIIKIINALRLYSFKI